MACKHWIGTIPKFDKDGVETPRFWENPNTLEHIAYLLGQEEKGNGETGYVHYQVYLVLKEKKRLTWLKKHIHQTAHWEKKRGTVAEAVDYVTKEDTRVPEGVHFEIGERPREQTEQATEKAAVNRIREKDDVQIEAQTILDRLNKGEFIAWREIPVDIQMKTGFLMAYNKATRDMVGPEREDLKIITIIGPPGCGKSYAISKLFPGAGRWIKGNNGHWFCNCKSEVMVFEEFSGQIELQSMLKYLDPYPLALEVKGGTEPAMYRLVIITSNTPIDSWYTVADEFRDRQGDPTAITTAKRRRIDALGALWDRLGYKRISRTNGTFYEYTLDENLGIPISEQINQIRDQIMTILSEAKSNLEHPEPLSLPSSQDPLASVPIFEHEELPDMSESEDDDDDDPLMAAAAAQTDDDTN